MNLLEVCGRIFIAAFLGSLIGMERERKKRAAGFRTHIIVSVSSCLIMLIAIDGFENFYGDKNWDATKFAGQVISGIGFLGAGTILQKKDVVTGLTTAATLWLSAAIGLGVGIGYYEGAIFATIICLITLVNLKGLSDYINKRITKSYTMTFNDSNFDSISFKEFTSKEAVEVRELNVIDEDFEDYSIINCTLSFPKNYNIHVFLNKLKKDFKLKSVKSIEKDN